MFFKQLLKDQTACASDLLGCTSHRQFAVVEAHIDLVERYLALTEAQGAPIVAVLETHVQADHVSGLPEGHAHRRNRVATRRRGVEFEHCAPGDGERVTLCNTVIEALATPGHAAAHHAYLVTDLTAETSRGWC